MEAERLTLAPRLTRHQVAVHLGVTRRTVTSWTAKGILTVKEWRSPGGRLYLDYDAAEVARLRDSMGVERRIDDDSYRA